MTSGKAEESEQGADRRSCCFRFYALRARDQCARAPSLSSPPVCHVSLSRSLSSNNQASHPHVVELLGAGFTPEGRRFLLVEHLPDGTLGTFHALSSREEMRGPSAYW